MTATVSGLREGLVVVDIGASLNKVPEGGDNKGNASNR